MTENPLVSVIIPARNAEKFISRCLNSVLLASRDLSIEVILILNGCRDKTVEIASFYFSNLPMQMGIHESTLGPAAARNIGIKMAKGTWLYFLDADDLIPDGALAKHFEIMAVSKSDILVGSYINSSNKISKSSHLLDEAIKFNSSNLREYILKYVYEPYFYTMPVHCWGKLYLRRSVIAAGILFDEKLDQLEDVNFNFSLILKDLTFEYTDQILYQYNINSGPNNLSTQSGDDPNALEKIQAAYIPIQRLLEKWEAAGTIDKASNYADHLFATTSLLWLIRVGKKIGTHNWVLCRLLISQIVNNSELRRSLHLYRKMPGTSRVIPFLVKLKLSSLLCVYFIIIAIIK